jgi:hypothetical protein
MSQLPTPDQMLAAAERELDNAYRALGDAADWLRSDWRPIGSSLTTEQAKRRQRMQAGIAKAKTAINQAKGASRGNS